MMLAKSWLALGAILIVIIVGGAVYFGTRSEATPTPTPAPTTPSPTITPTVTPTVPVNDTDAITQLLSSYHDSVRTKSLDTLLSLFTDDAALTTTDQLRLSGKVQIGGYFNNKFNEVEGKIDLQVTDTSITLEGSRATAKIRIVTDKELGSEFFELVKIRGSWRISRLTIFKF